MEGVSPQDTPENLGMCHSVLQVSFQLLIVTLNVLSSDSQALVDVVQPRVSYTYLQGLTQVLGIDFITVFFVRVLFFKNIILSPSIPLCLSFLDPKLPVRDEHLPPN